MVWFTGKLFCKTIQKTSADKQLWKSISEANYNKNKLYFHLWCGYIVWNFSFYVRVWPLPLRGSWICSLLSDWLMDSTWQVIVSLCQAFWFIWKQSRHLNVSANAEFSDPSSFMFININVSLDFVWQFPWNC